MAEKKGAGGKPQKFNEENGRYGTDKDRKLERAIDTYSDNPELDKKNAPLKSVQKPEIAYSFADKERKNTRHHKDHAKEMGYKNQDEYELAAVEFFNSDSGNLYYSNARGRYYRYDEHSGKFAASSNGVIHTFKYVTKKEFKRKIKQDDLYE